MTRPEGSLPEAVFLAVKLPVYREAVPPYWNDPINGSCSLQAVMVSSCWVMKWPRKLCGILSLY